tara:strand:- start:4407 stop:5741 length:1335 start_codon:yes stop_codon:yes gene_type:complete
MAIPAGVIILWDGIHSNIPSGWSRVTALDDRFPKGTLNATDPGANGGNATHTHGANSHTHVVATHTHTGASGTNNAQARANGSDWAPPDHTHTFTTGNANASNVTSGGDASAWGNADNDPVHHKFIFISSNGSPSGFPQHSSVLKANATIPAGWVQHVDSRDNMLKSAASSNGNGGTDGGTSTHTHTSASHTHTSPNHNHAAFGTSSTGGTSGQSWYSSGSQNEYHYINHNHTVTLSGSTGNAGASSAATGATNALTNDPSFRYLWCIDRTDSGDGYEEGVIVMWVGTLANAASTGYVLCDGSDDGLGGTTPDMRGKFVKIANTSGQIGSTGGAAGHQHTSGGGHTHTTATHTHPYTAGWSGASYPGWTSGLSNQYTTGGRGVKPHTHSITSMSSVTPALNNATNMQNGDAASTAEAEPLYHTVAFLSSPAAASGHVMLFGTNF